MILSTKALERSDLNGEFKQLTETFCELARRFGCEIRPYSGSELPYFGQLSNERKQEVLRHLRTYVEVASDVVRSGHSLVESPVFLLRMMKRLGFTMKPDLLDKVSSEKVIEIYDLRNIQIFRNLQFFRFSSYTFEELLVREWWQLYEREESVSRKLFLWASRILGGEVTSTINPEIGSHMMTEKASQLRFQIRMAFDCISPAQLNHEPAGLICVIQAELVESSGLQKA